MGPLLLENIEILKKTYSDYNPIYTLHDRNSLREFIGKHFDKDVLWAFEYLNPYAFKTDLARYCLVYILGGLYVDVGVRIHHKMNFGNWDFVFFRDIKKHSHTNNNFAVQNNLIYSKPNNIVFKKCIDQIVINCKNNFYGHDALAPTSPILFGQKIAQEEVNVNGYFGDVVELTGDRPNTNLAYILNDGTIVAFSKGWILFTDLATNTNQYASMWHNKEMYGTKRDQLNYIYNLHLGRNVEENEYQFYMNTNNLEVEKQLVNSEEYYKYKTKLEANRAI
jgi:hypothetical protein